MKILLPKIVAGFLLIFVFISSVEANTKLSAPSINKAFLVTAFPQQGEVVIGEYHSWVFRITDPDGNPVNNANIAISGGMIDHGHGLPSKPQMTSYLGGGDYLVEGMLFNMAGVWTLRFVIQTHTVTDGVQFDFDVDF